MNILKQKVLTDLMKFIEIYSDNHGKQCKVCRVYRRWAITALESKWLSCYIPLKPLVEKLTARHPSYAYTAHLLLGFSLYLHPIIKDNTLTSTAVHPCHS